MASTSIACFNSFKIHFAIGKMVIHKVVGPVYDEEWRNYQMAEEQRAEEESDAEEEAMELFEELRQTKEELRKVKKELVDALNELRKKT
jgi:hypothetical protein